MLTLRIFRYRPTRHLWHKQMRFNPPSQIPNPTGSQLSVESTVSPYSVSLTLYHSHFQQATSLCTSCSRISSQTLHSSGQGISRHSIKINHLFLTDTCGMMLAHWLPPPNQPCLHVMAQLCQTSPLISQAFLLRCGHSGPFSLVQLSSTTASNTINITTTFATWSGS